MKTGNLITLTALVGFVYTVGNWWLGLGVLIAFILRPISGHIISITTGLAIGILVVEFLKWLTYR